MTRRPRQRATEPDGVRERVIAAGARILAEGGREALTTRAVAAAAGIQAPTMYRLFGDKEGLLEAVAEEGLRQYVERKKAHAAKPDPLEDLRFGWDLNVEFALENPAIFSILSSQTHPGNLSRVAASGLEVLERRIRNVAAAGLLKVTEARAVDLVRAGGAGTVLTLLRLPKERRDPGLSAAAREAVIAAITNTRPVLRQVGVAGAAIALRASLGAATSLTAGERQLLSELLDRLAVR
jgi:AcrR family transcriptional regulator